MYLKECYIENFGKISSMKIEFKNGLNEIVAENGYGKTTLSVFIKSMLYGMDATKKVRLEENDRKHYAPWQGGRCGGSLTLVYGGKEYRIERTFATKAADDTFMLYDVDDGRTSNDFSENIGEELFGIDADGFERTVFLSERKLTVKNENKTISAKLSDLVGVDGDLSVLDEAVDALEERRKYYYKRGGSGKIADLTAELSRIESEIGELNRKKATLGEYDKRLNESAEALEEVKKKRTELSETEKTNAQRRIYRVKLKEASDARGALSEELTFYPTLPSEEQITEAQKLFFDAEGLEKEIKEKEIHADKAENYSAKINAADEMIKRLEALGTDDLLPKKLYPVLFLCTALLLLGAVCLAVLSEIILAVIPLFLSLIPSFIGIANLRSHRRAEDRKKQRDAELSRIVDFAKECKISADGDKLYANLLTYKASLTAKAETQSSERKKYEADSARLTQIKNTLTSFFTRYNLSSDDPFKELRARIKKREHLSAKIKAAEDDMRRIAETTGKSHEILSAEITDGKSDIYSADGEIRRLQSEYALIQKAKENALYEIGRIDELNAEKEQLEEEISHARERLSVINLAKEHLTLAKDNLTSKYLGKTRAAFAEYIALLSNEDPTRFTMDTEFALLRSEGGESMPLEAYSLGTRELYSLAMRLSLVDSLYEGEKPFIILDDPFAHLDDKRLEDGKRLISEIAKTRQIIYFTCTESRTV